MILSGQQHRRLNILTGEWMLVSPHRVKRPWQGKKESVSGSKLPDYDPTCYLCPGNERAGGAKNPKYTSTFVFRNDFSALLPDTPSGELHKDGLLVARSEQGLCDVMCFSPRHDLTLAEMDESSIEAVVKAWRKEYEAAGALPYINHVQIFENKGEIMGCSNPHPHCQIWSQESIPSEPAKEIFQMKDYMGRKKSCLLCDYLALELKENERLVLENKHFAAVVPFWAVWPFETMILSKRHLGSLKDLTEEE